MGIREGIVGFECRGFLFRVLFLGFCFIGKVIGVVGKINDGLIGGSFFGGIFF